MRKKDGRAWIGRAGIWPVVMSVMASCVSYDPSRVDTYIGPAGGGAPATMAGSASASAPVATGDSTGRAAELPAVPPVGPIRLNVYQALVLALGNNKALIVDQYHPPIRRTFEDSELAAFDPVLFGELSGGRKRLDQPAGQNDVSGAILRNLTHTASGQVGLTEFLPTGTHLAVTATGLATHDRVSGDQDVSRVGLSATQSLLRGHGLEVNLASLHQARIDTLSSAYELRGLAQSILAQTEEAYWDYVLSLRQVEIVVQSLDLAQKQLDEINARIEVRRLAESERAAAEAEVAFRRQNLIEARSQMAKNRLALLRLISPPGAGALEREVLVEQQPIVKDIPLEALAEHLAVAERMRPELNQSRLQINRDELEIVRTRNGLLPRLDLFVTLGKSGYSNSFGPTVGNIFARGGYDALIGVSGEYPLGNRAGRADFQRAVLGRDQSVKALENLRQLVELDVRDGYIEVERSREQIGATAATRKLQEEKLRSETEKFRVGRSTSLQVAQVQRDLVVSQLAEVQAVASCLKAYVELYRLDGSLLERRGIAAPGKEEVRLTAGR